MNEEKHAARLARWVDQVLDASAPPAEPPDDLDDDVLEAIAALRPDRAPGPKLTAEDILASIAEGPLKSPTVNGPVVPVAQVPAAANQPMLPSGGTIVQLEHGGKAEVPPRRRLWAALGGVGGVGVLLAVAASVLVVLGPWSKAPSPPHAASAPAAAGAEAPPSNLPVAVTTTTELPELSKSTPIPEVPPREVAAAPSGALGYVQTKGALPIAAAKPAARGASPSTEAGPSKVLDDAVVDADSPEPEIAQTGAYEQQQEHEQTGAMGGAMPEVAQAQTAAPEDESRESRDQKRKTPEKDRSQKADSWLAGGAASNELAPAASAPPPPPEEPKAEDKETSKQADLSAWSDGLDAQTRARFDQARTEASSLAHRGDYAAAATRLASVVTAPARAGMYHAALASEYWLQAGDTEKAVAVARQGLALSTVDSPERRALLAQLETAESTTNTQGATEMDEAH
jgi:hypothetical protein